MSRLAFDRVDVVVPAHDEEATVVECLRSLLLAREQLLRGRPRLECAIVLVLDDCSDRTAELVAGFDDRVVSLAIGARSVGAARRAGAEHAMRPAARQWLAQTDADSTVPPHWLSEHAEAAESGVELLLGTVEPTFATFSPQQRRTWHRTHPLGHLPGNVHGANLGIDAALYRRLGGYAALREHEDVDLVQRARADGARVEASGGLAVSTSDRRLGRTPGGYAAFLREVYPAGR
jgi:glycosyltransferase involved in cell wall biosynthesis